MVLRSVRGGQTVWLKQRSPWLCLWEWSSSMPWASVPSYCMTYLIMFPFENTGLSGVLSCIKSLFPAWVCRSPCIERDFLFSLAVCVLHPGKLTEPRLPFLWIPSWRRFFFRRPLPTWWYSEVKEPWAFGGLLVARHSGSQRSQWRQWGLRQWHWIGQLPRPYCVVCRHTL